MKYVIFNIVLKLEVFMDIRLKNMTVDVLVKKFAEMEKMQKMASSYVKKIDSLMSGLSALQTQLSAFADLMNPQHEVPNDKTNPTDSENIQEPKKREHGKIRKKITELLRTGSFTTRDLYVKLAELGEVPNIDTPNGKLAYRNHRGTISNMLKTGEIVSSEPGKERNCIWKLTK